MPVVLCLAACQAAAQVYRSTDAEGNTVFTDRPTAIDAQPVEVPRSNRMAPVLPTVRLAPPARPAPLPAYTTLAMRSPNPGATLHGPGNVTVELESRPALISGHRFQVALDGDVLAESTQPTVELTGLDRGAHSISALIVDAQGNVQISSSPQPLYVHRPSLAQQRRLSPCQKDDFGQRPECPLRDRPQ